MRKKDIERRVTRAVDHAAPGVLDRILSSCDEQKGTVIPMTEIVTTNQAHTKKKRRWAPIAAMAAVLVLCVGLFGYGDWRQAHTVDSVVLLDVNPSISITVSAKERVLDVAALNADGKAVIGDMDLEGTQLDVAVNALIGSMLQNGYLSDIQNSILVSVENRDAARSAQLQQALTEMISGMFRGSDLDASVLSQTVTENETLTAMAEQYGISIGKAALIQEVVAKDATLTVEALAPLSVNEIALISDSKNLSTETITHTGAASDKAYIGEDAAKAAAYAHAGVSASSVSWARAEFDSDDGVIVYEVEFFAGSTEYEYDIDARSGAVLKFSTERKDSPSGGTNTGAYIGEDAAKQAALSDAGWQEADCTYLRAKLEYDDGRAEHYEVEFLVGSTEYQYEVDLYTGAILKREQERQDDGWQQGQSGTQPTAPAATPAGAVYIGDSAAITAALAHAGYSESQVTELKCKLDEDDGRMVYEVEFDAGYLEYDYEIDAVTGAVLHFESDD